jgi:hypothetical protein
MPYDASKDSHPFGNERVTREQQAKKIAVVTADAGDLPAYAKALRVFVPSGTANPTVTVLLVGMADGDTPVELDFPEGLTYEPLLVRRVTAIASGVVVHALYD